MPSTRNLLTSQRRRDLKRQIPEALLAKLWRERATRQQDLRTTEGRRVRVLYPGRRGTEAGPDFRDALIYSETTGLVRGDVELHLHPKDWDRHGHATDHRYNGVVLHGVLAPPKSHQPLPGGGSAPAVELSSLMEPASSPGSQSANHHTVLWPLFKSHGYLKPVDRKEALSLLEQAGRARFLQKSDYLATLIEEFGPEEALYQSLMESLGYSENRSGFLELSQHLPYHTLLEAASTVPQSRRANRIEELLLQAAGFGNADEEPLMAGPVMDRSRWRLFRIRPANHPRRRMAGAAELLHRTASLGLLASTVRGVGAGSLKAILLDLTVPSPSGGPALIGRARALDIVVNILLPFVHAHAGRERDAALSRESLNLFMTAPKLQPNRITREMEEVLFPKPWRPLGNAAVRQQGLIHLHRLMRGEG